MDCIHQHTFTSTGASCNSSRNSCTRELLRALFFSFSFVLCSLFGPLSSSCTQATTYIHYLFIHRSIVISIQPALTIVHSSDFRWHIKLCFSAICRFLVVTGSRIIIQLWNSQKKAAHYNTVVTTISRGQRTFEIRFSGLGLYISGSPVSSKTRTINCMRTLPKMWPYMLHWLKQSWSICPLDSAACAPMDESFPSPSTTHKCKHIQKPPAHTN